MSEQRTSSAPANWLRPPIGVVHLVTTIEFGGLEKVVLDLVRCRTRETFDMRVMCLETAGALAPRYAELGIPVETIGRPGDRFPQRVARLASRLRALRTQVLHTHNPGPHLHGAFAAALARVPVLVHTKHGRNRVERRMVRVINNVNSRLTDCVIAVSDDAATVSRELERIPSSKVRTIHNGVDLEHYAYRGPRTDRSNLRAVTVARLDPVKDQGTMLRAVRLIVDEDPSFSLDIVGDGPLRGELESLRAQLGLDRHVRIHGFQVDIRPFLAQADIFLLSSVSEGIPLTLLEAMAVGLPGVATDVGGNREVIVDGVTGYLVPPHSPDSLAEAILALKADPVALDRFACASRSRVEDEFSLAVVVKRYESLYLELLAKKTGGNAGRVER
jgi:glycosyltransferase involved in cell wall biosynthesis